MDRTTARTRSLKVFAARGMPVVYHTAPIDIAAPRDQDGRDVHSRKEPAMGWPKRLVLVRHGESLGNTMTVDERATCEVSTHAYPLTPRGREQARITGD